IHKSLDYLEGRATVFHARYLSAWAGSSMGMKPPVPLGHFVLPPACLQEEIRRKIGCFIWEQADDPPSGEPSTNVREEPEAAGEGSEEEEEEDMVHLDNSSEEEATGSKSPAHGEFLYRALWEYPMNNMVTGYPSARDMKKYVGELRDFTPGASGYAVYWIQNGICLSSQGKSRKC
ncbi:PREDICTED: uncharacterized protein C15orf43 homolog, partial [Merops nubicus]|uniref:uncharacterized protein C15orf43 homolog n=1 Tax=Merops nubicus TaxID=57421 RepID=UPI0004F0B30F